MKHNRNKLCSYLPFYLFTCEIFLLQGILFKYKMKIGCLRYANQVSNGDEMLILRNDDLRPAKVINVSTVFMKGEHSC